MHCESCGKKIDSWEDEYYSTDRHFHGQGNSKFFCRECFAAMAGEEFMFPPIAQASNIRETDESLRNRLKAEIIGDPDASLKHFTLDKARGEDLENMAQMFGLKRIKAKT